MIISGTIQKNLWIKLTEYSEKENLIMDIGAKIYEQLIRDSVKLDLLKNYIKSSKFVDRDTLLILLGESEEKEND